MMPLRFTLGKNEKLKSRKKIEQIFSSGHRFSEFPFKAFYFFESTTPVYEQISKLQFGVGVSSKNFKKAIERNLIKRRTKEAWRLQKNELQELLTRKNKNLNVFLVYTGNEVPDFTITKNKVGLILKKLAAKTDENNSPDT